MRRRTRSGGSRRPSRSSRKGRTDELDRDGVIQRFEFTFELLWKGLKMFLEEQGVTDSRSPRECLKAAFRIGVIEDEETFLDMLDDRNRTSHIYDKGEAERIFLKIKSAYLGAIEKLLARLKTSGD
jgi:nucleotidyltransferase substrate binding protein (TIGR01987 family)